MKKLFYLLILMSLSSCTTYSFKTVSGAYGSKVESPQAFLDLRQDSTFIFVWEGEVESGSTAGKWIIKGNKLILNSESVKQIDSFTKFHVIKSLMNNAVDISFDLYQPDSLEPLCFASGLMFYEGEIIDRQNSDINGRMSFKKQEVDSIKISYIGLENIILSKIDYDYYKIASTAIDFNRHQVFANEKWRIRDHFLVDRKKNDFYHIKKYYKGD